MNWRSLIPRFRSPRALLASLPIPDLREVRGTVAIVVLSALGLNLALLFVVNHPLGSALRAADEQVRKLRASVDRRREQVAYLADARAFIDSQVQTVGLFFNEVLSGKSERMVAVQRELREIASRNGIQTDAIGYTHTAVEGTDDMVRFTASFPLNGDYTSLRKFLRDVESARNFLIIDGIELTKSREGGVILSLVIQVSTIFRDPDYRLLRAER